MRLLRVAAVYCADLLHLKEIKNHRAASGTRDTCCGPNRFRLHGTGYDLVLC
jgi:hypothetical protein